MELESQKRIDRMVGGTMLVLLKPFVVLLGKALRRNHGLAPNPTGRIAALKMLGGGSLVIALPALLGIRQRFPRARLQLVTTASIAPFARSLGVFDEILEIDQSSLPRLTRSGLAALLKCFRADSFLDLEVYSKLSTVFSVLSCARNRFGFYLESVVWRKPIHTHLIFFNRNAPAHLFYERMAGLLGAEPASFADCQSHVLRHLRIKTSERTDTTLAAKTDTVALGTGCSNLSRERLFSAAQWLEVFRRRMDRDPTLQHAQFEFLGAASDSPLADEILMLLRKEWPALRAQNFCGRLKLAESLERIALARVFWGIDSALLHYARLFGLETVSFWGPTSPEALLKPYPIREEVHYQKIPCSPCVHVAEFPPCEGRNICMQGHLEPLSQEELRKRLPVISDCL